MSDDIQIVDVWKENFFEEMTRIKDLVLNQGYNYIAMDTEFPGVPFLPRALTQQVDEEFSYYMTKENVDRLLLIQLGITVFNERGEMPKGVCCWQFNMQWDIEKESYAEPSIDVIQDAGIDLEQHKKRGIPHPKFGQHFLVSGLVCNPQVKWINFHGAYDFGYMYKHLTNEKLPDTVKEYQNNLAIYFPYNYDIKFMVSKVKEQFMKLEGRQSLSSLAEMFDIEWVANAHQAGSDSIVTGQIFFEMVNEYRLDINEFNKTLFGIGPDSINDEHYIEDYKNQVRNQPPMEEGDMHYEGYEDEQYYGDYDQYHQGHPYHSHQSYY